MKPVLPTLILLISTILWIGCSSDEQKETAANPAPQPKKLTEPFRFHKVLEIKPGLSFDVLSWGRGVDSVGSFLILRSDSVHSKFETLSADLEGKITDVWNMDMDSDGNPEIFIQSEKKNQGPMQLYVYEFNNSGDSQKLRFPDLTSSTMKSYRGQDSVYIKDDKLMREFPLYKPEDAEKPSDGKKVIEYSLRSNDFSVREIKQDTTASKDEAGKK